MRLPAAFRETPWLHPLCADDLAGVGLERGREVSPAYRWLLPSQLARLKLNRDCHFASLAEPRLYNGSTVYSSHTWHGHRGRLDRTTS
jgi:hypothetical protein